MLISFDVRLQAYPQKAVAGAPPPPTAYFPVSDTFNRADDATTLGTSSSGAEWVPVVGVWGISTNQACFVSGVGANRMAVIETGMPNASVQIDAVTATGSHQPGLTFRYKDINNWVAVRNVTNTGVPVEGLITVSTCVGGTVTVINSVAPPVGLVFPYTIRVEFSGSTVTTKINGSVVLTSTVTDHTDGTRHGLYGNSNASLRLDNFSITA